MNQNDKPDPISQVITLIRSARAGSLATVSEGQPFASLITPAAAPDRSLLMLLSGLSPHTRHLRQESRCSIMLVGEPTGPNPQTAPRISLAGAASPEPDPALKERWTALHPYAAFYAGLGDFQLWRFRAESAQFVGGFASAHRFRAADLAPDAAAVAAVEAARPRIIDHCNADHHEALDAIAALYGGPVGRWSMAACDVDGFDLVLNETVLRVGWGGPVNSAEDVRGALVRLATAARNSVAPVSGPGV